MTRTLSVIAALMLLITSPATSLARDKQKKKTEVHITVPVPDLRIAPLHPDKPLPEVKEPGKTRFSRTAYTGSHKAMNRVGIDVSHYQGQIDWSTVARNKRLLFVYCKATENVSLVDNTFQYNSREARRNGLPVGCYHFFSPTASGAAQLKHFMEVVDMSEQDLIPILDVEMRGKASLQKFQSEIKDFLTGFEKAYHFKPMIYCSANFYNKYLIGAFDGYKFMFAKYSDDIPNPDGPVDMVLWQYSANEHIKGIRGAVDISTFCDNNDVRDLMIRYQK